MKKLFLILALLLFTLPVWGQSTTVSGTITDSGGVSWSSALVTAKFIPLQGVSQYTWTGGPFGTAQQTVTTTADSFGSYSFSIPSNTAITPVGTLWQITVQSITSGSATAQITVQITGATQTVNFTPSAIRVDAGINPPAIAYSDAEVSAQAGQFYSQISTNNLRYCTASTGGVCTAWVNIGGGGGPGGLIQTDQLLDPTVNKITNLNGTTWQFINGFFGLPSGPNYVTQGVGQVGFDTTLSNWHLWNGTADTLLPVLPVALPAAGDLLTLCDAGGTITLCSAGPVGGTSGNNFLQVSITEPLVNNDVVCWVSANNDWEPCANGLPIIHITGATYTIGTEDAPSDRGDLLSFENCGAVAVTLPQAIAGGDFDENWYTIIKNNCPPGSGDITVTPTTSTISWNGTSSSSFVVHPTETFTIASETIGSGTYFPIGRTDTGDGSGGAAPIAAGVDLVQKNVGNEYVVDTGGVTINKLACRSNISKVVICPVGTVSGVMGVAEHTVAAAGTVEVQWGGKVSVISTNATTTGHWLIPSTTVAGEVEDTGSTSEPTTGAQTFLAETSVSGGQAVQFAFLNPDTINQAGGGGGGPASIQINGVNTKRVSNFANGGGVTWSKSDSGNVSTITATTAGGGGITSINSATGAAQTIRGVGGATVTTDTGTNTTTINGALGPPTPTWQNANASYTVPDSDNGYRDRSPTVGTYTLGTPNSNASSPLVGLRVISGGITSTPFTSSSFAQSAGNQMVVAVTRVYGANPVTSVTNSLGDSFVKKCEVLNASTPSSLSIWYASNLTASGSATLTVTFSATPGAADVYAEEVHGTTYDSVNCLDSASALGVSSPVHFASAVAFGIQANNSNFVGTGFTSLGQATASRISYRLLNNSSQVTYIDTADPNITVGVIVLSSTSVTTYVTGWSVLTENAITGGGYLTVTPTAANINGQSSNVQVPNMACNNLVGVSAYDTVCGFIPNINVYGNIGAPIEIGSRITNNTGDIGSTTIVTTGALDGAYTVEASITCRTAVAGQPTLTIGWTDTSNTAQTKATTGVDCTSLGANSTGSLVFAFRAKASTAITLTTTHANSQPTVDVDLSVYQRHTQ